MDNTTVNLSHNVSFRTVTGLTNRTFDGSSIVSGRGATEDQVRVIYDQCAELEAQVETMENSDTLNAIVASMRAEVDALSTQIEQCCNGSQLSAVIASMRAEVDALSTQIEQCCNRVVEDGADELNGTDSADVAVNVTWNVDAMNDGGQMTAASSSGAQIVMYYFLVRKGDGIFLKMTKANYAGNIVSVDTETGVISVTAGQAGAPVHKLIAGAMDVNGCEGLAAFSVAAAPWYSAGG